jgi:hypothetical protein
MGMQKHTLAKFRKWIATPPSAPPKQRLVWIAGSTEDPAGFSKQLRTLQASLYQANQPVVIENALQR